MKKYIFVGLGGAIGSLLRFCIRNFKLYGVNVAVNTLAINILGSFALAYILTMCASTKKINDDIKIGITVGFLGALTTFSTLCSETAGFINKQNFLGAILYIALTVILGFGMAYFGVVSANALLKRKVKR